VTTTTLVPALPHWRRAPILVALVLGAAATLTGTFYAASGILPRPTGWENQVAAAAWSAPALCAIGSLLVPRHPRTGAAILTLAASISLILAVPLGGVAASLALAIAAALLAAIAALYGVVSTGDTLANWHIRAGATVRPDWLTRFAAAKLASIPLFLVVLVVFIGCTIWTITYSFTNSISLPTANFVGWRQYDRLFHTLRWSISVKNLAVFGVTSLAFTFIIGFLLAIFMDQKIRFESAFRTIFLYPFALSFIVTGHVWAWIMNPTWGLQGALRNLGWTGFTFDWLANRDMVVYTLVIAGLWQGTGLTMALMLAGLRSIDDEVWKAARIDGIPTWRTYISIVIPMMRPVLVTTFVLSAAGIVRVYDLVVALTQGGPGLFSEMPSTYVMANLFGGALSQGLAASSVMLVITAIVFTPWAIVEFGRGSDARNRTQMV
jgi:glucose/mannose transport system permease protein